VRRASPRLLGERDVRFDPDDDKHEVDGGGEVGAVASLALHREGCVRLVDAACDAADRGGGFDFDAVGVELGVNEGAEVGVDGGQYLG
jgi:hypothetical protein